MNNTMNMLAAVLRPVAAPAPLCGQRGFDNGVSVIDGYIKESPR